jgi:hypothetical protein
MNFWNLLLASIIIIMLYKSVTFKMDWSEHPIIEGPGCSSIINKRTVLVLSPWA